MTKLLEASNISKSFLGTKALDDVTFDVEAGEVHALVGHNGSGKSTLIKILSGYHRPDPGSGTTVVSGKELRYGDSVASSQVGLRFIHQELGLLENLSVLENLKLGGAYRTGAAWRIRWREERRWARRVLETVGLELDPETLVSELTPIERTQVAVARALEDPSAVSVLVLDEPTATLPASEVDRLFGLIERALAQGVGIVYVSHRLEEIHQIANRVTVLREGRVVGTGPIAEFDEARLVELIVGRDSEQPTSSEAASTVREHAEERLRFDAVTAGRLDAASFTVRAGEIVGVAGLAGSGVHDIPAVLLGTLGVDSGSVALSGDVVDELKPDDLRARGAAVLPSARALKGIPSMSLRENVTLSDLRPLTRRVGLDLARERTEVRELLERFDVKPPEPEKILGELSGGNQQKIAVAKWLRVDPGLLVLDEPTQGVDVGAKAEILGLIRRAAEGGVAAVLCSSDLEDLANVCTRVLVIRHGKVATELTGGQITRHTITEECYRSAIAA